MQFIVQSRQNHPALNGDHLKNLKFDWKTETNLMISLLFAELFPEHRDLSLQGPVG